MTTATALKSRHLLGIEELDAAEIDSLIRTDDAGGMRPGMWTGSGVEILVRSEDVARAEEVLDSTATPPADPLQ